MKANDIFGVGKILPINKLIEVVSYSVGKLSKAYFDKKDIETKAYEIKKIAEARAVEMKIISDAIKENYNQTGGIEYKEDKLAISSPLKTLSSKDNTSPFLESTIEERAEIRQNFQNLKKQYNLENITSIAADELKNEAPIIEEDLDEDWTSRFFRHAEDISNQDMQILWGKILAGEIKKPKTFSLRTLELIKNLSSDEANIFMKIANFVIIENDYSFVYRGNNNEFIWKFGIHDKDIFRLTEIGILQPGDNISYSFEPSSRNVKFVLKIGDYTIIADKSGEVPKIDIPIYLLTKSGHELMKLISPETVFNYVEEVAKFIERENVKVNINI